MFLLNRLIAALTSAMEAVKTEKITHGTKKMTIATHCRRGIKNIILILPIASADSCRIQITV